MFELLNSPESIITMSNFIHLRSHSEFSVTDSLIRIKDLVKTVKQDNMVAIALTDLHNMFGFVKFYKECSANGIKPIVGAELNVIGADELKYKIIILVKNMLGLKLLNALITRAYIENKILDVPYIKEEWLLSSVYTDLIALSGGMYGDIGELIIQRKFNEAQVKAQLWSKSFPDNYYIELQRFAKNEVNLVVTQSVQIAQLLQIPVVATHPIQFMKDTDYIAHEVRVCIADGDTLENDSRIKKFTEDQYFLTQEQMQERFSDIPSAITNTCAIAKKCNLELTFGKYFLPDFALDDESNINDYLLTLSRKGLDKRLAEIKEEGEVVADIKIYEERLNIEIETINSMGFAGYFLIVADFINWAKENNIPVGPGRGSGAGSLVAFALGITDVEPLRYGLLFERFLNPERVSMPDFDIDFCQEKRELVIEYVKNKYGAEAVAQIATFGTMSSKAVIKDVGRALNLSYGLCDSLSKLILNTPAKSFGLLESCEQFPDLKVKIDNADEDVKKLWDLSLQLEDLTRNVGKHAAGVLIAPSKLTDFCPLYVADGMQTSQLDKDDVEKVGLVKFDFLGLRNLTIIQEAILNIKKLYGTELKLTQYDFKDKGVYELLQSGNTSAVFQLESPGMKRVLVKLEPDRFEDIIALLALYRPGPLGSGMVDDFIRRKKGIDAPNYFHDDLKECLESTYGVIVYQEQVMQISQIIGGYTLGGADLLRRAMGKKKPEEMAKHKSIFIEGALKKGYTEELAVELFDLMAMFAEYGFNKSHSAAYAVVSYHTAYLKAHYLTCFMAATLSSELDKTDKLYEFYQDCLDNDITLLPPDINQSEYRFIATSDTEIRYALGAVKGVGKHVVDLISLERNSNGKFLSFVDFCRRVDKKVINKKTLESLVKAGCFDSLETNRAKLYNGIAYVLDNVNKSQANINQASLFDDVFTDDGNAILMNEIILEEVIDWSIKDKLKMEKQAIGYYFSASLFDEYRDLVNKLNIMPLSTYNLENEDMQEVVNSRSRDRKKVLACGVINNIGSRPLKKGGKVYFINVEDDAGDLEFVIFNDDYEKYKELLKIDECIFIEGELIYDSFREQIKITAKKIYTFDDVLVEQVKRITLNINQDVKVEELKPMFMPDGHAKVIAYYMNAKAKCRLEFSEAHKFVASYPNLQSLSSVVGKHAWSIN